MKCMQVIEQLRNLVAEEVSKMILEDLQHLQGVINECMNSMKSKTLCLELISRLLAAHAEHVKLVAIPLGFDAAVEKLIEKW